jgi:hypothetical protein
MASHCRSCGLPVPNPHAELPFPDKLIPLEPHLGTLMDAAAEFDSFDDAPTSAGDFIRYLSVDVQKAAGVAYSRGRARPPVKGAA